jgi:hypothetical protein
MRWSPWEVSGDPFTFQPQLLAWQGQSLAGAHRVVRSVLRSDTPPSAIPASERLSHSTHERAPTSHDAELVITATSNRSSRNGRANGDSRGSADESFDCNIRAGGVSVGVGRRSFASARKAKHCGEIDRLRPLSPEAHPAPRSDLAAKPISALTEPRAGLTLVQYRRRSGAFPRTDGPPAFETHHAPPRTSARRVRRRTPPPGR